jgi:hypothetical protein
MRTKRRPDFLEDLPSGGSPRPKRPSAGLAFRTGPTQPRSGIRRGHHRNHHACLPLRTTDDRGGACRLAGTFPRRAALPRSPTGSRRRARYQGDHGGRIIRRASACRRPPRLSSVFVTGGARPYRDLRLHRGSFRSVCGACLTSGDRLTAGTAPTPSPVRCAGVLKRSVLSSSKKVCRP